MFYKNFDYTSINVAGARENGHISEFSRQTRHGLDSLSGATFGESKRYTPPR